MLIDKLKNVKITANGGSKGNYSGKALPRSEGEIHHPAFPYPELLKIFHDD